MKRIIMALSAHLALNMGLRLQDALLRGLPTGSGDASARPSRRVAYRKWRKRRASGKAS